MPLPSVIVAVAFPGAVTLIGVPETCQPPQVELVAPGKEIEFSGPPVIPLTCWEKYAQVLLLTNEFAFAD